MSTGIEGSELLQLEYPRAALPSPGPHFSYENKDRERSSVGGTSFGTYSHPTAVAEGWGVEEKEALVS